ncbi:MAG: carbonic anhydrase [Actinomycetota bacterium]|nr:carbonic anhydrase [Actinomycetota bacterium]
MGETDALLANNERYSTGFDKGDLPAEPARRVVVVTCMDARIDPAAALGLHEGDAHVLRNAGGVVTEDVLRSLTLSHHLLGAQEVLLMHHSRCAMAGMDEAGAIAQIEERSGGATVDFSLGAFDDLEADLRASAERIASHPLLSRLSVRAVLYEVETGKVREVAR